MRLALVATPRSGNTWFRKLLADLYELESLSVHTPAEIDWGTLPARCILQLHWHPTPEFLGQLKTGSFRAITIQRHPLDVLLSVLHFSAHEPQTARWLDGEGGGESTLHGAGPYSREFLDYVRSPRATALLSITPEWKSIPGVLSVCYEELATATEATLASVEEQLGPRRRDLATIVNNARIENLRRHSGNHHFWQGKPGHWSRLLTRRLVSEAYRTHGQVFELLGYERDYPPLPDSHESRLRWLEVCAPRPAAGGDDYFVSYAQNFEDVLLHRALKHVGRGFYVDIGAHDPEIDSVSLAFYQRGWRGVHVDPAARCIARLRASRPDETIIHAAVSDKSGFVEFHSFHRDGVELGISSCVAADAQRHREAGFTSEQTTVPTITLDGLLESLGSQEIHWLKIDVEGSEEAVIRGWNTNPARPWILVIESTRPLSTEQAHHSWEPLVLEKGYRLVHFDGLNRYYCSCAHPELEPAFAYPPCVFDYYAIAGSASNRQASLLNERLEGADSAQLELTERVHSLARSRAKAETALADVRHSLEEVQRCLAEQRSTLDRERAQSASLAIAFANQESAAIAERNQLEGRYRENLRVCEAERDQARAESGKVRGELELTEARLRQADHLLGSFQLELRQLRAEWTLERDQTAAERRQLHSTVAALLQANQDLSRGMTILQREVQELAEALGATQVGLSGLRHSVAGFGRELCDEIERGRASAAAAEVRSREEWMRGRQEIDRLNALLYAASPSQHLYRAWRVLLGDSHYSRKPHSTRKAYRLRRPWHTHLLRSLKAPFTRGDRPWHTHVYRAWKSLLGDVRYAPAPEPTDRPTPQQPPSGITMPEPTPVALAPSAGGTREHPPLDLVVRAAGIDQEALRRRVAERMDKHQ